MWKINDIIINHYKCIMELLRQLTGDNCIEQIKTLCWEREGERGAYEWRTQRVVVNGHLGVKTWWQNAWAVAVTEMVQEATDG